MESLFKVAIFMTTTLICLLIFDKISDGDAYKGMRYFFCLYCYIEASRGVK